MIGYLKGKVKYLDPECVLLEANGVGYEVQISGAAHSKLSSVKEGAEGEIYTYMQVREDAILLFGFADQTEKALFLKLTSVQGVGAKTALGILSALSPKEVSEAIAEADPRKFASVKGVGKKTADRIILELHGKVGADVLIAAAGEEISAKKLTGDEEDAISALLGLGFTRQESARAIERAKAAGAKSLEDILSLALRGM